MFETDPTLEVASRSGRVKDTAPDRDVHVTFPLIHDEAVVLDPGVSYAPSSMGVPLAGYKHALLQLYLKGGIGAAAANRTVTVSIEGTTGLTIAAAVRWIDIGIISLNLNTGLPGTTTWTSTGAAATEYLLDLGSLNLTHIRVKYDWDADPSVTPGMIVAWLRERAL